jgi:hypothetical protein
VNVVAQFVTGLLIVWLYAAMLPRLGTGLRTAGYAALVVWLCHVMFHVDWMLFGLMSVRMFTLAEGLALLQLLICAWVGSRLYGENSRGSGEITGGEARKGAGRGSNAA